MRIGEMHAGFALRLQEMDAERQTNVLPGEVDHYLHLAQLAVVKERAPLLGTNRIVTSDLAPLIRTEAVLPVIEGDDLFGKPTEPVVPMPLETLAFIRAEARLTRDRDPEILTAELVTCQPITEEDVETYEVTTDNDPWIPNPGVIQREDFLHLYVDKDTTVETVNVVFLRTPPPVRLDPADDYLNTDCQLPDHLHDEVLARAVQIALTDIVPKGQQP